MLPDPRFDRLSLRCQFCDAALSHTEVRDPVLLDRYTEPTCAGCHAELCAIADARRAEAISHAEAVELALAAVNS